MCYSGNLVFSLAEVRALVPLTGSLRALVLSENPLSESEDYRLSVLGILPHLERLDKDPVNREEREEAEQREKLLPSRPVPSRVNSPLPGRAPPSSSPRAERGVPDVNIALRKIVCLLSPDKEIIQNGDQMTIRTLTTFRNYVMEFRLGAEFREDLGAVDGRTCMEITVEDVICKQVFKKTK
ncbi:UNVERIFIED_CONTAM: hypothetical protein FKN15_021536 [Acipenser sinensis]